MLHVENYSFNSYRLYPISLYMETLTSTEKAADESHAFSLSLGATLPAEFIPSAVTNYAFLEGGKRNL